MRTLYFCPVISSSIYLSIYLFSSPNLSGRRLDVCHTSTHGVALVRIHIFIINFIHHKNDREKQFKKEFMTQHWNLLHAARWKCRTQKSPKIRHLRTMAQICRAVSSQLRHVWTIGKNVKQQYLPTCPYNMVNFCPLTAEIISLVWGVEQRAPPIFGMAAIALGIGLHSSYPSFHDPEWPSL